MTVTPASPPRELEPWFASRLHPLDVAPSGAGRSDYDLNPELQRTGRVLAEAAVLVPLVERARGLTVLLTRRADTLTRHSGQVAFPGGRRDPGESAVDAALREAWEEVGLDPAFVRPVGLGDLYETVTGFSVAPVVAFVREGFEIAPAEAEVAEVFEVPFAWLMDVANHALRARDDPGTGGRRRYYVMDWEGRAIWGATAGMIRGLHERLFGG